MNASISVTILWRINNAVSPTALLSRGVTEYSIQILSLQLSCRRNGAWRYWFFALWLFLDN
jgi:hypothetical protein